jgi:hypothetical protein
MIVTLKGSQMPRKDATPSGSGKILAIDPGALPPAITLDAFSVLNPHLLTQVVLPRREIFKVVIG